jgi:ribonuclease D
LNFKYEWVESSERLAELCQQWHSLDSIILDTEFVRTSTFYPAAGLIQVAAKGEFYLLDPIAISDMAPFASILTAPSIVKVLHSCSEDLEVFKRLLSVVPTPLFDTQIASSYASVGHNLSYQKLIMALLDVDVPKEETRSNWLKRPLTQSQLDYACLDVVYLEQAYVILVDSLTQQQRLSWLQEDCQGLVNKALSPMKATQMYQKIRWAWKLKPVSLAVLQHITAWREETAISKDLPRSHVVSDKVLWDAAHRLPQTIEALSRTEDIKHSAVRKYGEQFLQVIAKGIITPASEMPAEMDKPLPSRAGDMMKSLKKVLMGISEELSLAPEHLARKKELEELVRSGFTNGEYTLPEALCGWRKDIVGKPLLAWLNAQK